MQGWCNIAQSTESNTQCIRVHGKALELIGDGQRCMELSLHGHTLIRLSRLAAFMYKKWVDEINGGCKLRVITEYKSLTYFKAKQHTTGCHIRWQNFFYGFNCDIIYIKGHKNKVTDALSCYYESSTSEDVHYDDLVSADIKIDKYGEDLPLNPTEEVHQLLHFGNWRWVTDFSPVSVSDAIEQHQLDADNIDPPNEWIGRSELPLVELLGISNPITSDADIMAYESDKLWKEVMRNPASGNDVQSSLRLRELLKAQGAMRASRPYREVIVSARAR